MKVLLTFLLLLLLTAPAGAQGNQFKVRYRGGTVEAKVKPDDWKNALTISPDQILLTLKDGQRIEIDSKKVTKLSYGKDDARDPKRAMVSITAYLVSKKRRHFIGIAYQGPEGKNNVVTLQAKGDQYRTILASLKAVTGLEVETEKEKSK